MAVEGIGTVTAFPTATIATGTATASRTGGIGVPVPEEEATTTALRVTRITTLRHREPEALSCIRQTMGLGRRWRA
jgi:hypothetical protein